MSEHNLFSETSNRRGYRLQKLEVFNWGTFDDKVFSVRPDGQTTLLVGRNGSGKSTLVDALLTLLVRPGVRNLNVAAGTGKRERDERSYVKGAYDRGGDADGHGVQVKFLRPKPDQYSVILACFHDVGSGKSFTVAQLLYLSTDQDVQKVYCLSHDERSIQIDFAGLDCTDGLLKTLEARGFQATKTFRKFEAWFNRLTHVRSKAMEVFNQTVAVKDIQRLNDFIRKHMLEPHDWGEKVNRLLGHFAELSQAHESLVRVRKQFELLQPIAKSGGTYREQAAELDRSRSLVEAAEAFILHKTLEVFVPELDRRKAERSRVQFRKDALSTEIETVQEECRSIQNEIDQAGGSRLKEIPHLIKTERVQHEQKKKEYDRFHGALRRVGFGEVVADEETLAAVWRQLPALRAELQDAISANESMREDLAYERGQFRRSLGELREEYEGLNQRRENLPQWCAGLRQSLCGELGLAVKDLPFAAELISVVPAERAWEASIEKVLRSFALSLLVPDRYYHLVSRHVDQTRLTDARGLGRRLVYLRVGEQPRTNDGPTSGSQSLLRKLVLQERHSLVPWVKAELEQRFDYHCCESVEEFQQCRGLAMTRSRHIKSGNKRHEKDDRDESLDPRNFVLGWDNREKKQRIASEIERLQKKEAEIDRRIAHLDQDRQDLQLRFAAVESAGTVAAFSEIDFNRHEREIVRLEEERRAIEEQSNVIRLLKTRREQAQSRVAALKREWETTIEQQAILEKEMEEASTLIANANAGLRRRETDGTWALHREHFNELETALDEPLNADNFISKQNVLERKLRLRIDTLRETLRPVQEELLRQMNRFLREFPDEQADLVAGIDYLGSFLGLRQRIADEDLPRHEQRFKERLNQKVLEEIGLFRGELDRERRGIEDKVETLNVSLRRLEYRPGAHIQLEPRSVRDPEIVEFQLKLRECIEGSFEDSPEANEARFVRIQDLIRRLSDENNRRWRDKVIDVRQWFDFVASVIDRTTLKSVSVYEDSSGQSGGEKAKLAFTILVAAIAYQYDLDPDEPVHERFQFVAVDEMFSKVDDQHAEYALDLFKQFGLQLLIVAPLDAKARVTQPYVGYYLHVDKQDNRSAIFEMTAREFEESVHVAGNGRPTPLIDSHAS